jgi:hypothetical protein
MNASISADKIIVHHVLDIGVTLIIPSLVPIADGHVPPGLLLPPVMVAHRVGSPLVLPPLPVQECTKLPLYPPAVVSLAYSWVTSWGCGRLPCSLC